MPLPVRQSLTALGHGGAAGPSGRLLLISGSCGRFRLFGGRCFCGLFTDRQAERALHVTLDALQHFRLILQSLLRVLASLAQAFALIRKPRAAFFDYAIIRSQIEQVAFARNAFAVHYVELGLAE